MDKLPFEVTALNEFYCHTFPIDANRNESALKFLNGNYDISIWLDTDQDFRHKGKTDGLFRLLNNDYPIVAGMYYAKEYPYQPIVFKAINKEFRLFRPIIKYPKEELFYADMLGMGYIKVYREVFEKCKMPYFKYQRHPKKATTKDSEWRNEVGINDVSEDVWFFKQVKKAGYKVIVDPNCKAGHITKVIIDEDIYQATLRAEMKNILLTDGKEEASKILDNICSAEPISKAS